MSLRVSLLCLAAWQFAGTAAAQSIEVDLELALSVDVSGSMSVADNATQRFGYAAALTSDEVLGAISDGFLGRIGLTYVEWADEELQRVVVPWTLIETAADARRVADDILLRTGGTMRATSISRGLLFTARLFDDSPFTSFRRVIDISGDGPNNRGLPVAPVRDQVVAHGITINGLPLITSHDPVWHLPDLDAYYRDCVTGGPGSFVLPVTDFGNFPASVRRKLVLEIAGLPAQVIPAQAQGGGYDCLIGERIWQERELRRQRRRQAPAD